MKTVECYESTCRVHLVWLPTRKGKKMPVEADSLSEEDCKAVEAKDPPLYDPDRHSAHWNRCTRPGSFKKESQPVAPPSSPRTPHAAPHAAPQARTAPMSPLAKASPNAPAKFEELAFKTFLEALKKHFPAMEKIEQDSENLWRVRVCFLKAINVYEAAISQHFLEVLKK